MGSAGGEDPSALVYSGELENSFSVAGGTHAGSADDPEATGPDGDFGVASTVVTPR